MYIVTVIYTEELYIYKSQYTKSILTYITCYCEHSTTYVVTVNCNSQRQDGIINNITTQASAVMTWTTSLECQSRLLVVSKNKYNYKYNNNIQNIN